MFAIDGQILIGGALLLLAILSSLLSGKIGVPGLLLFLGVGMLAGEEGIGGIVFDDYRMAHGIGTVALVLILFDGGLQTPWSAFRLAWKPSVILATLGVVVTAGVTGLAAAWLLQLPILVGLLLGSIVGSTDAAAVFAILRGQGLHLRPRIAATLEVESGSNDPMAVLLTLAVVSMLVGDLEGGWDLARFFLQQAVVGSLSGLAVGWGGAWLSNRVNLGAVGLYPALTLGIGLLAYGLPAYLGGSGFLGVYLAGLVLGNSKIAFKRGILVMHDGAAWVAQIVMFIMLGLLASPSRLIEAAPSGLLTASALIFAARPLAVFGCLAFLRFTLRELIFISWAGLKGAIPIIIAIFPLMLGVPEGPVLFDVVFFVVLLSVITQGWSLPIVARWLGMREEGTPEAPITLEISSVRHLDGDIVEYRIEEGALATDRLVRELALPESAVIAMIAREHEIIPPRGSTRLEVGDFVFVVMKSEMRDRVDRMFARRVGTAVLPDPILEFPIAASTPVGELEEFYGVHLDPNPERTVGDLVRERLGSKMREGDEILAGELRLRAHRITEGVLDLVGVEIAGDR